MTDSFPRRTIRSYVRRQGRITRAQETALTELYPRWGLSANYPETLTALQQSTQTRYLEIGFGNGAALATLGQQHPDAQFVGVEVHRPGVGHLLWEIQRHALSNIHVFHGDCDAFFQLIQSNDPSTNKSAVNQSQQEHAEPFLGNLPREESDQGSASLVNTNRNDHPHLQFDGILIWFPDPWPKKKHHKRRLIQSAFIQRLAPILKPNGYLHLATDWFPYAEWMQEVMRSAGWKKIDAPKELAHFLIRPPSKYEQRGLRLGHGVTDLVYQCGSS